MHDDERGDDTAGAGAAQLRLLARAVADAVPSIVQQLVATGSRRVHRDTMMVLERPLIVHVLAMTGGNQLRAARILGLNRNTLRKRCRELQLTLPRGSRLTAATPPAAR
jgi:two-component system, NtrC family, nitrogen regulation response regulator GlnG